MDCGEGLSTIETRQTEEKREWYGSARQEKKMHDLRKAQQLVAKREDWHPTVA